MAIHTLLALGATMAAKWRTEEKATENAISFAAYTNGHAPMHASPINPDWVVEGQPQARLSSTSVGFDGSQGSMLWDCTAGTFRWYFAWHETVVILEGAVHVTDDRGNQRMLEVGDTAFFRAGTWATWKIDRYVRKAAFVKRPLPKPVASALQIVRSLKPSRVL